MRLLMSTDTPIGISGKAVSAARRDAGLTQHQLADLATVSHSTIQRAERSDEKIQIQTAMSIANALGVGIERIWRGQVPSAPRHDDSPPEWFRSANDEVHSKLDHIIRLLDDKRPRNGCTHKDARSNTA